MRILIILLIVFGLARCSNNDTAINEKEPFIEDSVLAWVTIPDSMIMKRDRTIPDTAITIERIINGLNQKYPEIPIIYIKQNGDTVFTKVTNGEYLGNQMGSSGAAAWYADAVLNLTAVRGINYVSFDIGVFSHASSAVIGKDKYQDWKRQ